MKRTTTRLLAALLMIAAAAALGACGSKDIQTPTGAIDIARDQAAKSQIMLVKTGISAYAATNGVAPPNASQEVLGSFIDPWPKNPWTGKPMANTGSTILFNTDFASVAAHPLVGG